MKIDAYSLDFSSSRTFSRTQTSRVSHEYAFMDIMDNRMAGLSGNLINPSSSDSQRASPWLSIVNLNGQEAVGLTDQFLFELDKMRQIMADIMARFQEIMSHGCSCQHARVFQIYDMPVQNFSMFRTWEYTQVRTYSHSETENLLVSAGGVVRTADNREIDFSFDLQMDRSFFREETFQFTQTGAVLTDPLVVQTEADAPLLWGGAFSFDLDLDGSNEDLPVPEPGYGFLSLDLNQDGKINDGSELFGPSTGSGFGELSDYDLDHNFWIDENDEIFDQLTLWERSESGEMTLTRIRDAGLGAIYLGGLDSGFDLRDEENTLTGRVRKTSIALTEAGEALGVHDLK